MTKRKHLRVNHKKTSQVTGDRDKFKKTQIYDRVTITQGDIKAMKSFQTDDTEFTEAIDYDGQHSRLTEFYVERGFEIEAKSLEKAKDPDYEILFHTHPRDNSLTRGPSGGDLSNMIMRYLNSPVESNQAFVMTGDHIYN